MPAPSRRKGYRNRRIGEFLKELKFTEGRATGIPKIMEAMANNGSPAAEFESDEERSYFMVRLPVHPAALEVESTSHAVQQVTPQVGTKLGLSWDQVTPEVTPEVRLIKVLKGTMSRRELQQALQLKDDEHFRKVYLLAALDQGLIEMAIPDKPQSSKQRYRLTDKGRQLLAALEGAE